MSRIAVISSGLALTLCAGCVSHSSLGLARTLPPGKVQGLTAPGLVASDFPREAGDPLRIPTPVLEFGARWGLTEDFDLGMKVWTYGVNLDLKSQLYRSPDPETGVDIAMAPGLGIASLPTWTGGIELFLPLLVGINFKGEHQLVLSSKLHTTFSSPDLAAGLYLGGGAGFAWKSSKKTRIMPELTIMYPLGVDVRDRLLIVQLAVGFLYDK